VAADEDPCRKKTSPAAACHGRAEAPACSRVVSSRPSK
jgi:hypothetical protein